MAPPDSLETSIWVVEDNELYRSATASLLEAQPGIACPVAVSTCEDALAALDGGEVPDIVLMDIGLPGMSGIDGCRRIAAISPASRIIMLTVHEERDTVFDAIVAGASGYLLKSSSPEEIVEAIHQVQAGGAPINAFIARRLLDTFARLQVPAADYGLTPREKQVLELLVEGLTMQAIADRICVSYHTVDAHVRNIYGKLHVHSRSVAVAKAVKERLV